jgi:hypothetical protein
VEDCGTNSRAAFFVFVREKRRNMTHFILHTSDIQGSKHEFQHSITFTAAAGRYAPRQRWKSVPALKSTDGPSAVFKKTTPCHDPECLNSLRFSGNVGILFLMVMSL